MAARVNLRSGQYIRLGIICHDITTWQIEGFNLNLLHFALSGL